MRGAVLVGESLVHAAFEKKPLPQRTLISKQYGFAALNLLLACTAFPWAPNWPFVLLRSRWKSIALYVILS